MSLSLLYNKKSIPSLGSHCHSSPHNWYNSYTDCTAHRSPPGIMIWNAEDGPSLQLSKKRGSGHQPRNVHRPIADMLGKGMEEDREAVFVSELSLPALYSHSSSSSSSEEFSFDVDTIKETGKSENTMETPPLFQEDAGRNDGFSSSSSDDSLVTKKNPIQMIKRKERRPVSRKRPAPSESIFDSDEFDVLRVALSRR